LENQTENLDYSTFMQEIAAKNFSISDVDFSICIKAENIKRYNEIYGILIEILYNSCNDISKFFDKYYDNALEGESIELLEQGKTEENTMSINTPILFSTQNALNEILTKLKYIEDYKFVNKDTLLNCPNLNELKYINLEKINTTRKSYIEEIKTLNLDVYSNELYQLNNSTSVIELSNVLNVCYQIMYISKITDKPCPKNIKSVVHNIHETMTKITNAKLNALIKANFYTSDKIKQYINTLESKLNALNKGVCHFTKRNAEVKITKLLNNEIQGNDIVINKKYNFKLVQDDLEMEDNKRIHYVSFNRSIHTIFSSYDLNFDLMRIKFNTTINNNLVVKKYSPEKSSLKDVNSIPSEFLDISIPNYSDYARKHYVTDMSYKELFGIPSYTIKQIYEDLIFVLYKQSYFVPWTDKKYEKRMGRSIIFGLLSGKENYKELVKLIELAYLHIEGKASIPYDYIQNSEFIHGSSNIKYTVDNLVNNEYNGYIKNYNSLMINKKYENIEDYLRNIIYFMALHKTDNLTYLRFLNNYRKNYSRNVVDNEYMDIFVDGYRQSFKDLLGIMHRYINIFMSIL
jgi:hypothetical protein